MTAVTLSLIADTSDGLARGYPGRISLGGDVTMESWQPTEAQVEARTLRAASDVVGPGIHGRVRSLVQEQIFLLAPVEADVMAHASRFLNAINAGAATGWLQAQELGETQIWRSPVRGGSIQLDGSSFRYEEKKRWRVTIIREPYFESTAAAAALGRHALRSRVPITLTAPDAGTIAAPIALRLGGRSDSAVRVHLYQDRSAPAAWTPGYSMRATAADTDSDGQPRIRFGSAAPAGKKLGREALYQPILAPIGTTNAAVVRAQRDLDGLTVRYGRAASGVGGESEVGVLGRLGGAASIFTGMGMVAVDEGTDSYLLTSYGGKISGTDWLLANAPTDGQMTTIVTGTGLLAGGPLYLAPGERCVILPLIELAGRSGEFTDSGLTLSASIRPRISEIV